MRRLALSVLAVTLITGPVWGAEEKNPHQFGSTPCGAPFMCSTYSGIDSSDPKIAALISIANACTKQGFGIGGNESIFKDEMGLDYNRCLTTKSLPKASTGVTMTPRCCIVDIGDEKCQLRCDLLAKR